jgi:hypothetical protein
VTVTSDDQNFQNFLQKSAVILFLIGVPEKNITYLGNGFDTTSAGADTTAVEAEGALRAVAFPARVLSHLSKSHLSGPWDQATHK